MESINKWTARLQADPDRETLEMGIDWFGLCHGFTLQSIGVSASTSEVDCKLAQIS